MSAMLGRYSSTPAVHVSHVYTLAHSTVSLPVFIDIADFHIVLHVHMGFLETFTNCSDSCHGSSGP